MPDARHPSRFGRYLGHLHLLVSNFRFEPVDRRYSAVARLLPRRRLGKQLA
jgi:hypothetical protein